VRRCIRREVTKLLSRHSTLNTVHRRYLLQILQELRELTPTARQKRSFLFTHTFPVKVPEPRVLNDLFESVFKVGAILGGTNSRLGSRQKTRQKVNAFLAQLTLGLRGHLKTLTPTKNLSARGDRIVGIKGSVPHKALKHDDTQRPPVNGTGVRVARRTILRGQYLGCNVIGSADSRVGHLCRERRLQFPCVSERVPFGFRSNASATLLNDNLPRDVSWRHGGSQAPFLRRFPRQSTWPWHRPPIDAYRYRATPEQTSRRFRLGSDSSHYHPYPPVPDASTFPRRPLAHP
jgi:hypothetical protein